MNKPTPRQAVLDLMNEFLMHIVEKPLWKREDVVQLFHRAMYNIAYDYMATPEEAEQDENDRRNR